MFQKRLSSGDAGSPVNLTPLIDVSLVLVVILLLATPLALQSSIALRGAQRTGKTAESQANVERIEISLFAADSLRVNELTVHRTDMSVVLVPLLERSERRQVVVTCADAVPHGVFVAVLDEAKLCGARDIAMMGR